MKLRLEVEDIDAIASRVAELLRPPALLTLAECGVSVRTLRAAIKRGELAATKVGRSYRVKRIDLDTWLASRRVAVRMVVAEPDESEADRALARAHRGGKLRVVRG